jgi:hypothetical protein
VEAAIKSLPFTSFAGMKEVELTAISTSTSYSSLGVQEWEETRIDLQTSLGFLP